MGRINRKRSTKIVTFAVLLSLFAYFMLKDKSEMDKSNEITSRDAVGLFRRGMYCHKTFTNESRNSHGLIGRQHCACLGEIAKE